VKIVKPIKEIVSYVHQSGDLNMEFFSLARAQMGTDVHIKLQKNYKKDECEIAVSQVLKFEEHEFHLSGRADLVLKKDLNWIVGEIKSTTRNLDQIKEFDRPAHYAQAKFYSYILLLQNPKLKNITVRLIYTDLDAKDTRSFEQIYDIIELEAFVMDTLARYIKWALILINSQNLKLSTAKQLLFPFGDFRKFQRELSGAVFNTIKSKKNLLLRAPTGIGKTMATIFPSLKALSNADQKIFYFTAKTIGRTVAENAFKVCYERGLRAKVTTITAKEKICFMDETRCDPAYCPYAAGYFDRIHDATEDLFTEEFIFDREVIEKYAKIHKVCPFEFSLAMASVSDAVIGDYNYLFDPRAFLRRFFEEPADHIVLVDEAHNLYDRACEMFSAVLSLKTLSSVDISLLQSSRTLVKAFNDYQDMFYSYSETIIKEEFRLEFDDNILKKVHKITEILERFLPKLPESESRSQLLNFYFELLQFSRIAEFYGENFRMRYGNLYEDFQISIICLDPGNLLAERLQNVKSAILFSATLHPLDYFQKVLLGDDNAEQLFLPSPFERENLDLQINYRLSTTYRDRSNTSSEIVEEIYKVTSQKIGNYLIFFPSYQYMEQIFDLYEIDYKKSQDIVMQQRLMNEQDREDFLSLFDIERKKPLVAFAVLGGIFSEGIDLIGDKLIGSVIIGVGLPQINPLTEQRRLYFDNLIGNGFYYAYTIPGFNKVMQAVGRVIRTEGDKGRVLMIDRRYMNKEYLDLFPYEWQHAKFNR